jgi:FtsZ-interacting cell division protein ZipA
MTARPSDGGFVDDKKTATQRPQHDTQHPNRQNQDPKHQEAMKHPVNQDPKHQDQKQYDPTHDQQNPAHDKSKTATGGSNK